MRKISVLVGAVLILLFSLTVAIEQTMGDSENTVYVDDDADSSWYDATHVKTIQEGVDNASTKYMIYVYQGTYYENVEITKSLSLEAENQETTIIDGSGNGTVVDITADETSISGFTITNSGSAPAEPLRAGITIRSNDNIISGNILMTNKHGIRLTSAEGNTITGNTISDNDNGISLYTSSDNDITDNTISDGQGIVLYDENSNNLIADNTISSTQNGVWIYISHNNTVQDNTISLTDDKGIYLFSGSDNIITGNSLSEGNYGILLQYSIRNTVSENTITDTQVYGISVTTATSTANTMTNNNFMTNEEHAHDDTTRNTWDSNYWDDYTGADADGDGIGDTPYPINDGSNQDLHPRILPIGLMLPLELSAPSSADENTSFEVRVQVSDIPINEVAVNISETTYFTNASGLALVQAPPVDEHTDMLITAFKPGYTSDSTWITILDVTSPTEGQLLLSAPSSITEDTQFVLTVTADGVPIVDAFILFAGSSYNTDDNGTISLLAPEVAIDVTYVITASKEGYSSGSISIDIYNVETIEKKGWITGIVTNTAGTLLEDARVCIILSETNNVVTSHCTLTDEEGVYTIPVTVGTYTVKADKQDYHTSTTSDVTVYKNTGTEVNFVLTKDADTPEEQFPIDLAIDQIVEGGNAFGEINIQFSQEQILQSEVTTYHDEVSIIVTAATKTQYSFTISGPEYYTNKIVALRFDRGTLEDMNNIGLLYDNTEIAWVPFDTILSGENNNSQPVWTSILTMDAEGNSNLYCLLRVPHFSTHDITIYQTIETLSGITAIAVYLVIAVIAAMVFVGSINLRRRL